MPLRCGTRRGVIRSTSWGALWTKHPSGHQHSVAAHTLCTVIRPSVEEDKVGTLDSLLA